MSGTSNGRQGILCHLCKTPIKVHIGINGGEYDLDKYYAGDAAGELQDMSYGETCDYYESKGGCGQTVYTPSIRAACQCGNAVIPHEDYVKLLRVGVDDNGHIAEYDDYPTPNGLTIAGTCLTIRRGG